MTVSISTTSVEGSSAILARNALLVSSAFFFRILKLNYASDKIGLFWM